MNALQLPIRDACFDHAISIAVVHHFSTLAHRVQALKGTLPPPSRPLSLLPLLFPSLRFFLSPCTMSRAGTYCASWRANPRLCMGNGAERENIRTARCDGPLAPQRGFLWRWRRRRWRRRRLGISPSPFSFLLFLFLSVLSRLFLSSIAFSH